MHSECERKTDNVLIPFIDANVARATDFSAGINGKEVPVLDMKTGAVLSFLMGSAPVCVRICADRDFSKAVIRPLSRGIKMEPDGPGCGILRIDRPGNFSIEFDGDIRRPLFLFASDISLAERPEGNAEQVICLEAGKIHRFDELRLSSGQTLFMEPGAVLEAPLRATDANDITITGAGIIDSRYRTEAPKSAVHFLNCGNLTIRGVHIIDSWGWTIHLQKCHNVRIENVKETCWRPNCDGVDINGSIGVHITDSFMYNTDDCIVIKSTSANEAAGTFCEGEKGRIDLSAADPTGTGDILVERTVLWNSIPGNAMEVGFELCGGNVSGITFRDCDIIRVERGACFSIHDAGNAVVTDVVFENIRIEEAMDELFDLYVGLSIYSNDCPDEYHRRRGFVLPDEFKDYESGDNAGQWVVMPGDRYAHFSAGRGKIERVRISDIHLTGNSVPRSIIKGYDEEHCVRGITIRNITAGNQKVSVFGDLKLIIKRAYNIQFPDDPAYSGNEPWEK